MVELDRQGGLVYVSSRESRQEPRHRRSFRPTVVLVPFRRIIRGEETHGLLIPRVQRFLAETSRRMMSFFSILSLDIAVLLYFPSVVLSLVPGRKLQWEC